MQVGTDGIYGDFSDETSVTIPVEETTEATVELYDANRLTDLGRNEINNGYFSLTYYIDDTEVSFREFGDKPSQYVTFKVLYDGSWRGALGTESGQRSISWRSDAHLPVDNDASIVSGNVQKTDDGSGTLTVQILVDGDVVTLTAAQYGMAQVSESV